MTRRYPEETPAPRRGRRGTPRLVPPNCTVEKDCADSCPTGAISVRAADGAHVWQLDYGLCIFCGNCLEACPSGAIVATAEFELSARTRPSLVEVYTMERASSE